MYSRLPYLSLKYWSNFHTSRHCPPYCLSKSATGLVMVLEV